MELVTNTKVRSMFLSLLVRNRKSICKENSYFVLGQRARGDYSVGYSIYLNVSTEVFEKNYALTRLKYDKGNKDLRAPVNITEEYYLDEDMMEPLRVPLTKPIGQGENDFVLYAALDLMGAVYTKYCKEIYGSADYTSYCQDEEGEIKVSISSIL